MHTYIKHEPCRTVFSIIPRSFARYSRAPFTTLHQTPHCQSYPTQRYYWM